MPKKSLPLQNFQYTATAARANLYGMLKDASTHHYTYEITQRQASPVVMLSKEKFEKLLKYVPEKERAQFKSSFVLKQTSPSNVKYPETLQLIRKWRAKANKNADPHKIPSRDEIYVEELKRKGLL